MQCPHYTNLTIAPINILPETILKKSTTAKNIDFKPEIYQMMKISFVIFTLMVTKLYDHV